MRRLARATVLATSSLVVGCFDPRVVYVEREPSSDSTTMENDALPSDPPAAGSTSTSAAEEPGTSSGAASSTSGDPSTGSTSADVGSSSDEATSDTSGSSDTSGLPKASTTEAHDDSSSGDPCGAELPMLLWVADATVAFPMALDVASYLPGAPLMARSYAADAGSVSFEFQLACETELTVHGLVWDYTEGAEPQNADSYHVTVDGLPVPAPVWAYGCETLGLGSESWSWQTLTEWSGIGCGSGPYDITLGPGLHEITLLNREAGSGGIDVAAIAAIVVTDDPGLDPSTLYDPSP